LLCSCHGTQIANKYVVLVAGRIAITADGCALATAMAGDAFRIEKVSERPSKIAENVRKLSAASPPEAARRICTSDACPAIQTVQPFP
jgi:hypothetical protein